MVPGGYQGAVHDQHGIFGEPLSRLQRELRPEVVDDAVRSGLRHPEQRRLLVDALSGVMRQYAATSSTRSSRLSFHGRPRPGASAPSRLRAATNFPKARELSPVNGTIQDGSDAVITPVTTEIIALAACRPQPARIMKVRRLRPALRPG